MKHLLALLVTILGATFAGAQTPKKLLLLAQGPDGHPVETHEYDKGLKILQNLLAKTPGLEVSVVRADEPWREGPELLAKADGVVLFLSEGARWLSADPARAKAFADFAGRKTGAVGIHWGIGTKDAKNIDPFLKLLGGCHGGPDRKFQVLPKVAVKVVDPKHPIAKGLDEFTIREEFYYNLKRVPDWRPLLNAHIDGQDETVSWTWQRPGGGRSFGFTGLHFHDNWQSPEYRRLLTQGTLWTMGLLEK